MNTINLGKIYGFDYLRAICCIIVIGIHSNISILLFGNENIHNIVVYHIFQLAVPVFFQTALVLFFINRQKYPDYFLKKRLFKLIKLYLFWGLFAHLFNLIFKNAAYMDFLNQSLNFNNVLAFIVQDGYSNPFYFIFSLLFVTTLAELVSKLIDKTKTKLEFIAYPGFILSSIIVVILPLTPNFLDEKFNLLSQAFNPLNFIPYIFSSLLISQDLIHQKQKNEIYQINYLQIFILLFMFIIFSLVEWQYLSQTVIWEGIEHKLVPIYSRLSLVFSAWLITVISLKISLVPNLIIKLISDLSLGIYCLHTFIYILIVDSMIAIFPYQTYLPILLFLITLILSILLTRIFRGFPIFQDII